MRIMASETVVLGRFVNDTGFLHGIFDLTMAVEAHIPARGKQKMPVVTGVRIVTVRTVSFSYYVVDARHFIGQKIVMALEADLFRFGVKKVPMVGCVRVMALGTFPITYGIVHMAQLQFLPEHLVTFEAKVTVRAGFELQIVLR
jgi:hypothetical protein